MYVTLSLYGVNVNCLVDTGSTITVLKKQYYDSLIDDQRPPLQACHGRLRMADGSEVSVNRRRMEDVCIIVLNGIKPCLLPSRSWTSAVVEC